MSIWIRISNSHSPDFPATFLILKDIGVPYTKEKMNPGDFGDLRSSNITGIFNKQIVHLRAKENC